MQLICHAIGIDVSEADLDICGLDVFQDRSSQITERKKIKNRRTGFKQLVKWLERKAPNKELVHLTVEATGRYHEKLAYYLFEAGYRISVVLPNRIKYFARSINEYSKTDALDAQTIASFTALHAPKSWQPANKSMRQLRELSREREQLTKMSTRSKNRLAALKAGHKPLQDTVKRLNKQVAFFKRQIEQIEAEMDLLRANDEQLNRSMELLTSIPYIGEITAYAIISETNGFELFENRNQLISYAGLDLVEKQSGSSVRGKSRISKRGNARLRSAPYPGLASVGRGKSPFTKTYQQAIERGMEKKQARTAVVRQLLRVAFGVHKSGKAYCSEIHLSRTKKKIDEPESSPIVTHSVN